MTEVMIARKHLLFLDLMQLAARYDCMALIDFHCMLLFEHTRISQLTADQQAELAEAARADIFSQALAAGYRPSDHSIVTRRVHDCLC